jgi:hypothetical protein
MHPLKINGLQFGARGVTRLPVLALHALDLQAGLGARPQAEIQNFCKSTFHKEARADRGRRRRTTKLAIKASAGARRSLTKRCEVDPK